MRQDPAKQAYKQLRAIEERLIDKHSGSNRPCRGWAECGCNLAKLIRGISRILDDREPQ